MSDQLDPLDPSPYKTLNVAKDATLPQIRSAHRKLVLIYHPDKVQDENEKKIKAEKFHQVQQAYEILSDETRRRRWDERSKLAELRAELAEDRTPLRRAQTYTPRATQNPIFEVRGDRLYEERIPKPARTFDEDIFTSTFTSDLPRTRKYDTRYDDLPPPRKTSGRGPEERRRYTNFDEDDYYEKKAREKARKDEVKYAQNEKQKQRDKAKRNASEAKFSKKAYVEDEDSASVSGDERRYSSKSDSRSKNKDEDHKRSRNETSRRGSKKDSKGYDSDLDRKIYNVHDYMSKSRENIDSDRRRPTRARADSYREQVQLPSPPMTPVERDYGRRSSGDDGRRGSGRARTSRPPSPVRKTSASKSSSKYKIVEPAPSSSRKPSLPTGGSERVSAKEKSSKREPQRSATFTPESKPGKKPTMKRAETMPIDQMRQERDPRKSTSKLKNMTTAPGRFHDVSSSLSDSLSETDSEDDLVLPKKSSKAPPPASSRREFKVSYTDDGPSPRIVTAEPEDYSPLRSRDVSPKNPRRSDERTRDNRDKRAPPPRAHTFQERPSPRHMNSEKTVPPLRTNHSSRETGTSKLFMEIDSDQHSPKTTSGSPKIYLDDRFRHSRKSSEDVERDIHRRRGPAISSRA